GCSNDRCWFFHGARSFDALKSKLVFSCKSLADDRIAAVDVPSHQFPVSDVRSRDVVDVPYRVDDERLVCGPDDLQELLPQRDLFMDVQNDCAKSAQVSFGNRAWVNI